MPVDKDAVRSFMPYVDSWLAYRQGYLRVPGVQAAVLVDDEVVLSAAHGHADVEGDVALTAGHLFRVASHSKTFTATALLQLVEAGRLGLDDAVGSWLSWLDGVSAKLTIRELLSHSSGMVRDSADGDFWQLTHPFPDVAELRSIALGDVEILPANERFKYSNIAYSLLGLVIEAVSGTTYNDYVSTEIVARLGLANTGPELDPGRLGDYAAGYSSLAYAPSRVPIDHVDTSAMSAATGFFSTAEDLCDYFSAHFTGDSRLLTDASKRLMQHRWWDVDRTPDTAYGLGLAISKIGERQLLGHSGGYPGHITKTFFDPDDRFVVSVLTNAIDGPASELATSVVKLIDLCVTQEPLPDNGQARFCGRFANLWSVRDIASLQGNLVLLDPTVVDPTESRWDLEVVDETSLRVAAGPGYGAVGEPLDFTFAPDGSIERVHGPGGLTMWPLASYRTPPHVTAP